MPSTAALTGPHPPRRTLRRAPSPTPRTPEGARTLTARSPLAPGLTLTTTAAWHLARRAAQAPTAAIAADVLRMGTTAWLEEQLAPSRIDDSACENLVATTLPWAVRTAAQVRDDPRSGGAYWKAAPHLAESLLLRPLFTRRVLLESVVECLGDMLYVSLAGRAEGFCAEHDQILRRHALGRYADLLHAAVTGPGLLRYLNNDDNSRDSVNENLGRELLELYTVGTGHYTQDDVRDSAKILSGHGIDWDRLAYVYRPQAHWTGPVTVMGFSSMNADAAGGPALLRAYTDYLARHPATAQRVARRLAVRFVSDTPSAAFVSELASVYLASDTALVPVLRRLFTHAEFTASAGAKLRRPLEWVATGLRSKQVSTYVPGKDRRDYPWEGSGTFWLLDGLGQHPRHWPTVDGYPDTAASWLSTMGTLGALSGSDAVAHPWGPDYVTRPWGQVLGLAPGQLAWDAARRMTLQLTGWVWPDAHVAPLAGYLAKHTASPVPTTATISQGSIDWWADSVVRMILASPYARLR